MIKLVAGSNRSYNYYESVGLTMSTELFNVVTPLAESDEEKFSGKFCECGHALAEWHEEDKCYGLYYNGLVYSSCNCRKPRPITYAIEFQVNTSETKLAA